MDMSSYLQEMHFAVEQVLDGLWEERGALRRLQADLAKLTQVVHENYARAESIAHDAMDADDVMHATAMHWETYFGDDKERHARVQEQPQLEARLETRQFSLSALAGTTLQYAKQGISVVHGSLASCPNGRSIGSVAFKDVIWQARNQASHWEDGKPHPPVVRCFETLKAEQDAVFGDYTQRSLADEVVTLLDWRDWVTFEADMQSLA
jgi:hypothetical protein